MMSYQHIKRNSHKEYLGFCDRKGFIYSVPVDVRRQAVVALKNGEAEVLIVFTRPHKEDVL